MNKYPSVSRVVSTSDNVEVSMENVIPESNQYYRKIPLTVHVVPHEGRIFLYFSGMADTHIEITRQSANGMYIEFVNSTKSK